jgi:NACHT domain
MIESHSRPPDPTKAYTPTEFVQSMVRLKDWAGQPSLSKLQQLGGQKVTPQGTKIDILPKSTISHVLRKTDKLPRWDFVKAYITACLRYCEYPSDQIPVELERWRAARRVLAGQPTRTSPPPGSPGHATSPNHATSQNLGASMAAPEIEAAPETDGAPESAIGRLEPQVDGPFPTPTADHAVSDDAVDLLARRVAREEDRARKGLLGGYSVAPISYGPPADPIRHRGPAFGVDGDLRSGDLHSIGSFFLSLQPQRLLIIGEPGAGKTVLAIELVLQLVESLVGSDRRSGAHSVVPVRLNAARWTSGTPLETWLTDQLVHNFGLTGRDATRLVRDRQVLPVLDGLDELDPEPSKHPPRRAIGLLTELNRYSRPSGRQPAAVVVTCRADRYAQLIEARVSLDNATRIDLRSLTSEQIIAYVRARWPDDHPCALDRDSIQAALTGPAQTTVHAALATPWRLSLAVTAAESGDDPAELLHADPNADPYEAVELIAQRLLRAYIPAATKLTPRGSHRRPHDPEQVRTWLVNLADHLQWQAGHAVDMKRPPPGLTAIDITPHLLWPIGGPHRIRALHFLCCLILTVIAMAAFWAGSTVGRLENPLDGLDVRERLSLALMTGWIVIATGLSLRPWPAATGGRADVRLRQRLSGGLLGALAGGPIGVMGGLAGLVLTDGKVFGIAFAIAAGLAGGMVFGGAVGATAAGHRGGERMSLFETVRTDPVVLLGFGLCGAITGLPPLQHAHAGPMALCLGSVGAFALALALGAVFKVAMGGWSKDAELAHPREALSRNPTIGVAFGLTGGVAAMLVFIMNQGVLESMICALIGGVAFGLALGAIAWSRSMIGLIIAAMRGLLPLRLWTFLDWACEARLLRVSGATYQFRHRELQNFLTSGETGSHNH